MANLIVLGHFDPIVIISTKLPCSRTRP